MVIGNGDQKVQVSLIFALFVSMPVIKLETLIHASRPVVFDLARSIDLHQVSTAHTNEKAVGGKTSGLIELNDFVIWEARHFGVVQRLSSKITEMKISEYFVDEMVFGAFKSFRHEHVFEERPDGTLMVDVFNYVSPLGFLGRLADRMFLEKYMTDLLLQRNRIIKSHAEKHAK